jgi:hypothetical protein
LHRNIVLVLVLVLVLETGGNKAMEYWSDGVLGKRRNPRDEADGIAPLEFESAIARP